MSLFDGDVQNDVEMLLCLNQQNCIFREKQKSTIKCISVYSSRMACICLHKDCGWWRKQEVQRRKIVKQDRKVPKGSRRNHWLCTCHCQLWKQRKLSWETTYFESISYIWRLPRSFCHKLSSRSDCLWYWTLWTQTLQILADTKPDYTKENHWNALISNTLAYMYL